ncbi:MAG TPA: PTS sugar transporter subunit IIB [Candidatus Limnocylindria bacterium]|nr:PTS sugar transporter subunit IIB [Candidatus Limnocylindria bacterium]
MSWLLARVDDRLIHGQVVVAWGDRLRPRRIWVVDDGTAADPWEREMLSAAAPGVDVRVATVSEAAEAYATEAAAEGGAILLVRNLATAHALIEAGAAITTLNLGGLHYMPGKVKVNEYVYLDDTDRGHARALLARGVALEVQDIPAARPQALSALDSALRQS